MSRSIYGSNAGSRPIYGISKKLDSSCICEPTVSPLVALSTLQGILADLRVALERFYNQTFGIAPLAADMSMRAVVSTPVFMRMLWIKENPGVKFDKTNLTHLNGLKFIYNLQNRDWRNDPLFKAIE
jgi:hypothetical protein